MDKRNLEDIKQSNDQWDESDISNYDMLSISNMSNMVSMSSMPTNMYVPNMQNSIKYSDKI